MFEELALENDRLRKELEELQSERLQKLREFESKVENERATHQSSTELLHQRGAELQTMMTRMVRLTRQLDEEVTRRDEIQAESSALERTVHDLAKGPKAKLRDVPHSPTSSSRKGEGQEQEQALRERGQQVSTKLMRVVDQWMRQKDLQQALLRKAAINDSAFSTLVQALLDCPSLQTLDLSQNLLTMDSCSDICLLITTAPSLSFVSLAENLFSLRSVGYFMTAVMERQSGNKLQPLDLLDLSGNEGLVACASAPCPEYLQRQVRSSLGSTAHLPDKAVEVLAQVLRALWRFLYDTEHPQVKDVDPDEVAFNNLDKGTLAKMENALMKILLLSNDGKVSQRPITANLVFPSSLEPLQEEASSPREGRSAGSQGASGGLGATSQEEQEGGKASREKSSENQRASKHRVKQAEQNFDPFAHVRLVVEPPKEKLKTFNLKQIVTRKGTVLMNMLERLLEVTDINAHDVETEQTLLEYACKNGNIGLAKLCCRRGANLNAKTKTGDTAFNIVTRSKRYDMMEFLHTYGVKVNAADAEGLTPLHVAAQGDDVDAVCRLLEWGADVNAFDSKKRTPIHLAASGGNQRVTMLLLEVGANMNAKDEREYTAVAHAEARNHFALMDRLVQLGGRGHGLQASRRDLERARSAKQIGELVVSASMLKSTSLGRIGKVSAKGMSGPLCASLGRSA